MSLMTEILQELRREDLFWLLALPMVTWPAYFYLKSRLARRSDRTRLERVRTERIPSKFTRP
jgi:predicted LPLAT superfamily acyltransferase